MRVWALSGMEPINKLNGRYTSSLSELPYSQVSVLDAAAGIPRSSPLAKRLLLPLSMAGADSLSPHQRHHTVIKIQEIRSQTDFRITVPDIFEKVWKDRVAQDKDDRKAVPWMEIRK